MARPKPRFRGIPHLVGAIIALPAVVMLAKAAQPGLYTNAAVIYGTCLMCLLGSSATYHTPYWPKPIRARLRVLDHAMIYVLIGGSYVPYLATLGDAAPSWIGPVVLIGSTLGVLQTFFWSNAPRALRTMAYVVLGLIAVIIMPAMYTHLGTDIFWLMTAGGICYLVGAVIYARRYPNPNPLVFGYHEVFHCLVDLAAAIHFVAMWRILT